MYHVGVAEQCKFGEIGGRVDQSLVKQMRVR